MAELTYRDAVARGIAQEMERDEDVVFLGEDVAAAGGVFKSTVGLLEKFGPIRVRDCPISEQAILGAAMGAAMTGLKPIAEIMFSDFFAVCFDYIANEFPKSRYMSNGQLKCPLVVRTANGAGSRFGAQHSQSVENWAMMIPGLKVVAPSTPRDVIGLLAAAVRDPDPVIFFEHKSLYPTKGEVPDGEIVDTLGTARIVRPGKDATILALALMVPRALAAAERLQAEAGIDCEVVDVRSLVPLDTQTILKSRRAHASPLHCRGEPAPLRLGRGDRVDRRRRGVLRPRRSAGPDHDAAPSAPRRRRSRRHDPPERRPDCRPHSAVLELLRRRHGRADAAARRNCHRRQDHEVVQVDRRDGRARRQSLRDRNRQGHGRSAGDRRSACSLAINADVGTVAPVGTVIAIVAAPAKATPGRTAPPPHRPALRCLLPPRPSSHPATSERAGERTKRPRPVPRSRYAAPEFRPGAARERHPCHAARATSCRRSIICSSRR